MSLTHVAVHKKKANSALNTQQKRCYSEYRNKVLTSFPVDIYCTEHAFETFLLNENTYDVSKPEQQKFNLIKILFNRFKIIWGNSMRDQ